MYNDEGVKICGRYTVSYQGYIFDGDKSGDAWNSFDTDSWDEVTIYMYEYPDIIYVTDNEYDVEWHNGEWY